MPKNIKHLTDEWKKKIGLANAIATKKVWAEKRMPLHVLKNLTESSKRRKEKFGYVNSPETRKKISETMKLKWRNGEVTENQKKVLFGRNSEYRKATQFKKGHKFSKESLIKMSKSHIGLQTLDKHPNWKGGISFKGYSFSWNNKFKRMIRKRDNYICMNCGIHQERLSEALNIHHINYDKKLTIPQNCISLCRECHQHTNKNRNLWTTFFQSLLSEKYNYKYNEKQEVIINDGSI